MNISTIKRNVTLSTVEASFVSLTECAKQGIWFKILFKEIFIKEIFFKEIKIKIMEDNKACIEITKYTNSKGRCKHRY